jgi:hypothetical protein
MRALLFVALVACTDDGGRKSIEEIEQIAMDANEPIACNLGEWPDPDAPGQFFTRCPTACPEPPPNVRVPSDLSCALATDGFAMMETVDGVIGHCIALDDGVLWLPCVCANDTQRHPPCG